MARALLVFSDLDVVGVEGHDSGFFFWFDFIYAFFPLLSFWAYLLETGLNMLKMGTCVII